MTTKINNNFSQINSKDLTWDWAKSWHSKIPRVYTRYLEDEEGNYIVDEEGNWIEERKEDQHFYNIAIIGNTGVGKSSLLNYLYPDAMAQTGNGKPVTKNGFHEYKFEMRGKQVCVYDSWGLEAGKEDQWHFELDQELSKRRIDQSASDWFHSIFYCISAAESRIQESDKKIINKIIESKYPINIILTKADGINEDQRKDFLETIKNVYPDIKVIPVCSEAKPTRAGDTVQFGKDELEAQALEDFLDAMIMRGPEKIKFLMGDKLLSWASYHINAANRCAEGIVFSTFSVLDRNKCLADANRALKSLIEEMNESTKTALEDMFSVYQSNARFINEDLISKSSMFFMDIDRYEGSDGTEYKKDTRDLYFEYGSGLPFGLDQTAWVVASTVDAISSIPSAIADVLTSGGNERKLNLSAVENHIREVFVRIQLSILRKANEVEDNLESLKRNKNDIEPVVKVDGDLNNEGSITHAEAEELIRSGATIITPPPEKLRVIALVDSSLKDQVIDNFSMAHPKAILNRVIGKKEVLSVDTKKRLIAEAFALRDGGNRDHALVRVGSITFDFELTGVSLDHIRGCHNGMGYASWMTFKDNDKLSKGHKSISIDEAWWSELVEYKPHVPTNEPK